MKRLREPSGFEPIRFVLNAAGLLFSPAGRMSRGTYWVLHACHLSLVLLSFLTVVVIGEFFHRLYYRIEELLALQFIGILILVWISGTISQIKRCHDVGRSGKACLTALIPIWGPIIFFTEVLLRPGDPGPNDYGPPPGEDQHSLRR